ncbi:hypothetical protein MTO96_045317, partial [Rhipicephalus appendiculatus]
DGGQPDVRGRQRRRSRLLSRVAGLHPGLESQGAGENIKHGSNAASQGQAKHSHLD